MNKTSHFLGTGIVYNDFKLGNIISVNGHKYIIITIPKLKSGYFAILCTDCGKISKFKAVSSAVKTICNDIIDFETSSDKEKVFCDYHSCIFTNISKNKAYNWKSKKLRMFYNNIVTRKVICKEWKNDRESFENFILSKNYIDGYSKLRRINYNKPFGPDNIRIIN